MKVVRLQNLKPYNTFGIKAIAREMFFVDRETELPLLSSVFRTKEPLIIGSGSNILFVRNPLQPVIKLNFKGIEILNRTEEFIEVSVKAGTVWDDFVRWTVENNIFGVVNLSYIPGTVGAAPVQNIGAYGTEVAEFITKVHFFHIQEQKFITLDKEQCQFGYRTSIFKTELKNKAIITRVDFRLPLKPYYNLNYKDLEHLKNAKNLSLLTLRLSIGKIRMHKLPDPSIIGNAGSFFKNPIITKEQFNSLKQKYPDIPSYPMDGNKIKIPAGWLIDRLGLKGYRSGDAGVYPNNALVLVNYGNATGKDIFNLAQFIQDKVMEHYNIWLLPEVNIIM